jgi:chemotaxis protein MotB
MLSIVAAVIQQTQNPISIEGHTDNLPIKNARYPSNWELSTARATSVLISLLRDYQFSPERFSASGYGEYRPMTTNATPEGRAKNRRVDIIFVTAKERT